MDILFLLDRLEEELTSGRAVPFTDHKLIDEQECLDILDQIRAAVPDEIKASRRITQDRDQLLEQARQEAERMVRAADEQLAGRVNEHAMVRAAESRAADLEEEALRRADEVRRQADQYAYQVLEHLRKQVEQVEQTVERGLRELAPTGGADGALTRR